VAAMFDGSIACYLRDIQKFPLLSRAEEYGLAKRCRENDDLDATQRLVTSHLRLVAKIAMRYRGYGRPISEVISEGNIGLVQAVRRFDPDRGVRLATYAISWIRAAIMEYILRSGSLVRMGTTAAQRKLFFNLGRLRQRMGAINDGDPSPDVASKIAAELGVPEAEVFSMSRRLAGPDYSLNAAVRIAGVEDGDEWSTLLRDDAPNQETVIAERAEQERRRRLVDEALKLLNARERDIIEERCFKDEPTTLTELGGRHGVSCERIRQIEQGAIEKMRRAVGLNPDGEARLTSLASLPRRGAASRSADLPSRILR